MTRRIAVLASGGGSNLQAILDYFAGRPGAGSVVLVASDRKSCGALDKARAAGVAAVSCAPEHIEALLAEHAVDLVALAGYLRFVPTAVTEQYHGRMINVHPALLPAFGGAGMYGIKVHEAVLASGARVSGPTVHFVNDEYDRGTIIAQWPVPVLEGDTAQILAARVLAVEHMLYPRALAAVAAGHITLDSQGRARTAGLLEIPTDAVAFNATVDRDGVIETMDTWFASAR